VKIADGKLSGTAYFVQDAKKVDFLVVSAKQGSQIGLYVVPADASGVRMVADSIVDLTRDQAHVEFDRVAVQWVAAPLGQGDVVLDKATPAHLVVLAADMCGAGEWQLQTTVEYAKVRVQFDRPIGFFQAIKHPLVEVMLQLDQARSLLYNAACAVDHEPEQADMFSRMAKAAASDMAAFASRRAVQSHGGIGFTWECFQQLYFKRQMHNQQLLGDATYHRSRLAEQIIGPIGAR
jgi:alkylation response protein AidB-like acyl-CoA dehydrogenase